MQVIVEHFVSDRLLTGPQNTVDKIQMASFFMLFFQTYDIADVP